MPKKTEYRLTGLPALLIIGGPWLIGVVMLMVWVIKGASA